MRRTLIKIIKFLDKPFPLWFCGILGILLMVIPPIYAGSKGITSLSPGFGYGVLYGIGICLFICSEESFFDQMKKAAADREK